MTRYHATPEGNIPFTAQEETEWEAREAAWNARADERKAAEVREERDSLLVASDWVVTKAIDTSTNIPVSWKNYRQGLRNITNQEGFPNDITWPTKPN